MDDEDHGNDVDASLMDTETSISECRAKQPAAMFIDAEKDEEGQCEGAEGSGSLIKSTEIHWKCSHREQTGAHRMAVHWVMGTETHWLR